jgi:hypothetical protein
MSPDNTLFSIPYMAPKTLPGVPLGAAMHHPAPPTPPGPHPFAQYPYGSRPQVDPRYVGPGWAAPAPHPMVYQPPPRRRSGWGVFALTVCAILGLGIAAVGTALGYGASLFRDLRLPTLPTDIPSPTVTAARVPLPTTQIPQVNAPVMTSTYKGGYCAGSNAERTDDDYRVTRNSGSALSLRGRVAALHVMLGGGRQAWPTALTTKIQEAALLSQRFYLDQAARHGVTDLTFEVIAWPLMDAPVDLPKLTVDGRKRLDDQTEQAVHDDAQKAIERALGTSLESVVLAYREKGYASVAFYIHLPITTNARDFAMRATAKHPKTKPEIAILFPNVDPLGDLAVVVAHEGFHLFGADDLYRQKGFDPRDAHDVMSDYCTGFKQAIAGDATAYAVGWSATPPVRPFRWDEK